MELRERLQKKKEAIIQRWLHDALATYADEAASAFGREKDPFANPVGHSLRGGTRGIFEALLEGTDSDETHQYLHEIIRIRAVQQFSPSQSLGFVFALKKAIRAELGREATDPRFAGDLAEIDERIDRIALAAFDIFVQCREQVYELRVSEAKRRVSWIVDKMNERELDSEFAQIDSGEEV
jgi:hypothetical protein